MDNVKQWLLGIGTILAFFPIQILELFKFILIDIPMMAGERDDKNTK
jgi:hypothetical protein